MAHAPAPESPALTLRLEEAGAADLPRVGGKGANLGVLIGAGIPVPAGFSVTTEAYRRFAAGLPGAEGIFSALDALDGTRVEAARRAAGAMRAALEARKVPAEVVSAVRAAWRALGTEHALAVRSSATAEDLPGASFAGQQDTFLNVRGEAALLDAVRRCWVSLFTDRAVLYRARGGLGHRGVELAVVVQRLVVPEASGILFTADPVSGHRGLLSIDAGFGLGEALVGGLVNADLYRFDRRTRAITLARPGDKAFAIRPLPSGTGTWREPLSGDRRTARVLDDAQVRALAELGERVEGVYGGVPQDLEWCLEGGRFHLVQARPITSLFPVPRPPGGGEAYRVYVSFGHVQMMHDAMPRLAREVWAYFFPAAKGGVPRRGSRPVPSPAVVEAGSRLYLDVTAVLRVPRARAGVLAGLGVVYEEMSRGLGALSAHPAIAGAPAPLLPLARKVGAVLGPVLGRVPLLLLFADPVRAVARAQAGFEALWTGMRDRIAAASPGAGRIRQTMAELHSVFVEVRWPLSRLATGVISHRLLKRVARGAWAAGVQDDVDALLRGLPGNVTTAMDLEVGDLADLARPFPALCALLREGAGAGGWLPLRARLQAADGGPGFLAALDAFLATSGSRAAGEIDLSRPRWREEPAVVLRAVAGGLARAEPGGHRRQHQDKVREGEAAMARLVEAAGRGPGGLPRRWLVRRLCLFARHGQGLREHPKFMLVRVLEVARAEARAAGTLLVARGQLDHPAQVFHLGFEELARALEDPSQDLRRLAAGREAELRADAPRRPPFVISSEGETPAPAPARAGLPPGALQGTAASGGVVEGRVRVVRDPDREVLEAGEVLVAPFTDPGWTPLFVHAAAVVTEVGGLMTHGAVVAREYGIPAVVSVAGATEKLRSGQRVRVDGTRGFVLPLEEP